jgi:putative glycosyltransferase
MKVSIVTSLYRSAPYVEEFYRRCAAAITPRFTDLEFVFIDDGSPDQSWKAAERLFGSPHRIRVVRLSRNYGAMRAFMEGVRHSTGDLVFLLDADLEEAPELFQKLHDVLVARQNSEDPVDLVYTVQDRRKGGFFERVSGTIFYRTFNFLSSVDVPPDLMACRLMTRRYVDAFISHHETELYFSGIAMLTGFSHAGIVATKGSNRSTSYTLARKLSLTLNALTSFSSRPLYLIFVLGLLVAAAALVFGVYLFSRIVFFHIPYAPGWSSLLLAISFFGGLNLASIGVVGLYLGRVLMEVKHRPCIVQSLSENL